MTNKTTQTNESTTLTAKEICVAAWMGMRELQTKLGVPERELEELPEGKLRSNSRLGKLTEQFNSVAAVCREILAARPAPEAFDSAAAEAELVAARKRCERLQNEVKKLNKGDAFYFHSFEDLSLKQLIDVEVYNRDEMSWLAARAAAQEKS